MTGSGSRGRRSGVAMWGPVIILVVLGGNYAMRSASNAGRAPALAGVGAQVDTPAVFIALPGESAEAPGEDDSAGDLRPSALHLSALRAGAHWRGLGRQCTVANPSSVGDAAGWGLSILPERFSAQPTAWPSMGIHVEDDRLRTPDGRTWPRASVAIAVTLTRGQLEAHSERFGWLGRQEIIDRTAGAVTWVFADSANGVPMCAAIEALSQGAPPSAPKVVVWSRGQRVFQTDLDTPGYPRPEHRAFPVVDPPAGASPGTEDGKQSSVRSSNLLRRAAQIAEAIRPLREARGTALEIKPPTVHGIDDVAPRARDGAVQRSGWYDVAENRLVLLRNVTASVDDALFAWTEVELLRALGPSASAWFARGLAYLYTGRAGGFTLQQIEARTGSLTMDDVLQEHRGRTWMTLAAAEARLARCVLAELNSDVRAAWALDLDADPALVAAVLSRWTESLNQTPVAAERPRQRPMAEGVFVEMSPSARAYGSQQMRIELRRIARAGFRGVQFEVHVPVVPPGLTERRARAAGAAGWGASVTTEGDGAILASAAAARAAGLSVVLAPRFVSSASSGPGRLQIHGSPELVQAYGDRRALAMEGAAWLAEQMGAAAIVMFDAEDLPWASGDDELAATADARFRTPELAAARASTRRQGLLYSAPFTGERLSFARTESGRTRAAEDNGINSSPAIPDGGSIRIGLEMFEGPDPRIASVLGGRLTRVGELATPTPALRVLRVRGATPTVAAAAVAAGPRTLFLGPWVHGRRFAGWKGLRDWSADELSQAARLQGR